MTAKGEWFIMSGQTAAWEEGRTEADLASWLEQYGDRLLRMCTLYLKDPYLAEDAVQDALLRAYRAWPSFRGDSTELTWLTGIAINVCRSYLRSPWKRRRVAAEAMDGLLAGGELRLPDDTLPRAIMALPRKYREVVLLHYYQELKAREIAALLGLSVSGVTVRLARARAQLKDALKGWYYDEDEE